MPRLRNAALRVWGTLSGRKPLSVASVTADLLVPLLSAQATAYRVRPLATASVGPDRAPLGPVIIHEHRLLSPPGTTELVFDLFSPSVHVIGKRFTRSPQALRSIGTSHRKSSRGAARQPALLKPAQDFLWDSVLLVLQPPLDLKLTDIVDLPYELYKFQIPGIEFLAQAQPGALLGDDMGLGKTIQAIVALRLLFQAGRITRALVVCPRSILRQWEDELWKWAPLLRCEMAYGLADHRRVVWNSDAHVYLTSYGSLRQDIQVIAKRAADQTGFAFDVVVLDEITNIKNPRTKRSRATKSLPRRRGWGLSGTPLENRLDDVVGLFSFLCPRLFPPAADPNADEVREAIRPYFMRRRKQDTEVWEHLPPKLYQTEWITLTREQRRAYDIAYEEGVVHLRDSAETVTVQHILALLQKLKQICNFDPETGASAKMKRLRNLWPEIAENGNKALVFSQWVDFGVDRICELLSADHAVLRYVGNMSLSQREQARRQFCASPDVGGLVLTYGTGAHGLNLQAANYVVRFDHWWNPAVEEQAVDRCHRIGQTRRVTVTDLWVEDSIEERIYEILERKRRLFDTVIDSLAVCGVEHTGLTEEELFGLFDLKPPQRGGKPRKPTPQALLGLSPIEFERLVGEVFKARGYQTVLTPVSGDAGLDVIAYKDDPVNPQTIAIQCKNHSGPVGRPAAQKLLGASADPKYRIAVLVATMGFTEECMDFARKQGKMELMDGAHLCSLMDELGVSLPTR